MIQNQIKMVQVQLTIKAHYLAMISNKIIKWVSQRTNGRLYTKIYTLCLLLNLSHKTTYMINYL